jgi:hypothetical protein
VLRWEGEQKWSTKRWDWESSKILSKVESDLKI